MSAVPHTPLLDPLTENEAPGAPAETTVLVIDDDPVMWSMLSMLGREYGFAVKTASDGVEGLQLAEQSDADLIVLDLNLPRMTGLDVCRRLRSAGIEVPIVMGPANPGTVGILVRLQIGPDHSAANPFDVPEAA